MADHFLGINRGKPGFADSDFVYGTSTGATDIEVRIKDSAGLTEYEVVLALEAFVRFIESRRTIAVAKDIPVT